MIDKKKLNAENIILHGVDITEKWETAVSQSEALNRAHIHGIADGQKRSWIPCSERLPEGENMYMSPITIMQGEMKMRLEGEIMKAIAGYEIDIDKDELIKALNYDRQQYEKGYKDGLNKSNEWISCDKHLPEDENEVLITVNGKFNNITFDNAIEIGFYNEVDGWIINGYLDWITPDVTAWMPCPEQYKGE